MAGEQNLSLVEFRGIPVERRYRNSVDSYLISHLNYLDSQVGQMAKHHLGFETEDGSTSIHSAGKQLRPTSLLLTIDAMGGAWDAAVPAAGAIELFHNATLAHDDVEDGDESRHGKPTMGKIWGEARAINSGDIFFAESTGLLFRLPRDIYNTETILKAAQMFSDQTKKVFQGQELDIRFEKEAYITRDQYEEMISLKTGALFSLSFGMGALLAGRDEQTIGQMSEFGLNLGRGFQLADDLSELVDPKTIPSDILKRKKTLPVVLAQEREDVEGYSRFMQLISPNYDPPTGVESREILDFLQKAGTIEEAKKFLEALNQELITEVEEKLPIEKWAAEDFSKMVSLTLKV